MGSQNEQLKTAAYPELGLLILILTIWVFSIWLCFNRYSKLRTLQPGQPLYNSAPMHINQVRIVENERDGMIIFKKKPSAYDRKLSPSGYLNTSSSKISLLHTYQADTCLMQAAVGASNGCDEGSIGGGAGGGSGSGDADGMIARTPHVVIEPFIVVDTPRSNSCTQLSSVSQPDIFDDYVNLFHRSVPAYGIHRSTGQGRVHKNHHHSNQNHHHHHHHNHHNPNYYQGRHRNYRTFERYQTINTAHHYHLQHSHRYNQKHHNRMMAAAATVATTTSSSTTALPAQSRHFSSSRHKLTKQAPVQLNVTPPPPDRNDSASIASMLHRVSDRRNMYAKSKFSFKRLPMSTQQRPSTEIALDSFEASAEATSSSCRPQQQQQQSQNQQSRYLSDKSNRQLHHQAAVHHALLLSTSHDHSDEAAETGATSTRPGTAGSRSSKKQQQKQLTVIAVEKRPASAAGAAGAATEGSSSHHELLDPEQIPVQVRQSLLDMHYHLHQKPPLLQTSRISKSDSNIKVLAPQNVLLQQSKKLLSLQKSSCD